MDQHELVLIVVTAVISVTVKELVTWIFSIIKSLIITATIKAKASVIFSKANRAIFFDICGLLFYVALLVNFARDPAPLTRLTVLLEIGIVVLIFVYAISLLFKFAKKQIEREENLH